MGRVFARWTRPFRDRNHKIEEMQMPWCGGAGWFGGMAPQPFFTQQELLTMMEEGAEPHLIHSP